MNLITRSVCLFIGFCVINGLFAKDLHIKQTVTKENEDNFFEIFQDEHFMENKRSARHVKVVTESILDHILKEFKRTLHYTPQRRNRTKILRKFKEKLKKHVKKRKMRKTKMKNATMNKRL
ncbi:hypothetical protein K1T71_013673 [Dendrolimus kikuchii]|uniref:Uncharacterized protein n=1 Tax=Dendrolimus kikuchii TaxID=765133 RepID=A0ACC1CHD5_9NEOP|nr:hypothetical protein K1T71_013673 [Dendrolimus kikuchii]